MKENDIKNPIFNTLKPYIASLIVVLICVFPLFKFEYSTDTYHFALHPGLDGIIEAMRYNGRIISMLGAMLLDKINVSFTAFYYVSFIMSIIFSTLSITTLYKMLKGHISRNLAFFIAIITILNPLSFEHFLFIEKGFFAFAIFMAVLSAKFFLLFLQGKKGYLILSYIFLTLCAFTYQALPAAFVALAVAFIVIYSKNVKSFISNTAIAASVYGFATFMIFIAMKIFDLAKRAGVGFNLKNIYKFLTFGLGKPYLLLVYVLVFTALFLSVFISSKRACGAFFTKESTLAFFKYAFVIVATVIATSAPCPFSKPEDVWFTPRFAYSVGLLVGTIPILHFFKPEKVDKNLNDEKLFTKDTYKKSLVMLSALFIIMSVFHSFYFSRHITNASDKKDAMIIQEKIAEYENETGIEIKKISIYYDKNSSDGYSGTVFLPNCNVRALSRKWCDVAHLSLFHERSYKKVDNNKDCKEYFSSRDWDKFENDSFIFENDTLHLCVY